MFKIIKQSFIGLLSFSGSLARVASVSDCTKCTSLNKKQCLAGPTLIDLNSIERHYYPDMVKLDRCNGSCYILGHLSKQNMCSE